MPIPALRVVVFPSDDSVLNRDVHDVLRRLPAALTSDLARTAVERELRHWYRSLTIHERDAFGAYPDDPTVVWYVYRDGRVRRHNPSLERLHTALGVARTTCADSERALTNARGAARSAGYAEVPLATDGFDPVVAQRGSPRF